MRFCNHTSGTLKLFLGISIMLIQTELMGQAKDLQTFAGLYNGTPGVVVFDLALKKMGPITSQPFMLSTAVKIYKCSEEGLPLKEERKMLNEFSKAVEQLLKSKVKYTFAGTFSHDCVRLNYFFVTDTTGLRQEFVLLYKEKFPTRTLGLNMEEDKKWETYFKFLLPDNNNYGVLKHPIIIKPK